MVNSAISSHTLPLLDSFQNNIPSPLIRYGIRGKTMIFKNLNITALAFKASFYETLELASLGGFERMDPNVPEIIKLRGRRQ